MKPKNAPFEPSYSIKDFCDAEGISEVTYYTKLRAKGIGPKETRIPGTNLVRITHRNRLKWHDKLEDPDGEFAEVLQQAKDHMRAKGRHAARLAVESPNHISKHRKRRQKEEAV
jgi:hypothetical protein